MNHTPSPWKLDIEDNPYIYVNGSNDDPICEVYQNPEQKVNMNLIAAAPDLLAMLKAIVEAPVVTIPILDLQPARDLIARVEGKEDGACKGKTGG